MNSKQVIFHAGALSCLCLFATPEADAARKKPNVIYILMDDLGYGDLGCYGQQKIETPNIDRLRENGIRFTQHYSGSPVSAPSRCVLLTGQHSGHAQIRANDEMPKRGDVHSHQAMLEHPELEGQAPLKAGTVTLGTLMQEAGYTTACIGKWGLGYPGSEGEPNRQGFDFFYGYNCQRQAHTYYPPFLYRNDRREYLDNRVIDPHQSALPKEADPYDERNYDYLTQKQYANDLIFDEVIRFVDENEHNPFFLMWTTPLPHVSLQAPERWVKYYVSKFGDEKPKPQGGYYPCRYPHATYAAMVSYFDEQVGRLIEELKERGIYENTVIIFTSDNGPTFNGGSDSPWFNSGGPFRSEYGWGKCFLHEGGIRVPMIVSWPRRIREPGETDHVCAFQDVMPTLAEIAGVKCPPTDGISLLPVLRGRKAETHDYLYFEYPDKAIGMKAVRWGKWKGIIENIRKGNSTMQLYDLESDPREEKDIAAQHPEIVRKLEQIMKAEHTEPENPVFRF